MQYHIARQSRAPQKQTHERRLARAVMLQETKQVCPQAPSPPDWLRFRTGRRSWPGALEIGGQISDLPLAAGLLTLLPEHLPGILLVGQTGTKVAMARLPRPNGTHTFSSDPSGGLWPVLSGQLSHCTCRRELNQDPKKIAPPQFQNECLEPIINTSPDLPGQVWP